MGWFTKKKKGETTEEELQEVQTQETVAEAEEVETEKASETVDTEIPAEIPADGDPGDYRLNGKIAPEFYDTPLLSA